MTLQSSTKRTARVVCSVLALTGMGWLEAKFDGNREYPLSLEPLPATPLDSAATTPFALHDIRPQFLLQDSERVRIMRTVLEGGASSACIGLNDGSLVTITCANEGFVVALTDSKRRQECTFEVDRYGSPRSALTVDRIQLDQVLMKIEHGIEERSRYENRIAPLKRILAGERHADVLMGELWISIDRGPAGYLLQGFNRRTGQNTFQINLLENGMPVPGAQRGDIDRLIELLEQCPSERPDDTRQAVLRRRMA